ncbi:iron complex transport system permease protein [Pontibacter ummariensis]|uniref:Iron complex transport system permease protein n=1 Tax=Pontibacter ummariensis TaxID=1610492 RepID=A0A239KVN6_9BACT|nr:iron ABC transporter permease [Pontibacter ummariensis]PRY04933.1 iron complex transport system permease protein [Pontibacter ummariensis]SNT22437.1 iron complex transport system permease protein [Pontibacter ummariensis]
MRRGLYFLLALLLILVVLLLGLQVGSFDSDIATILNAFLHYDPDNTTHFAIMHLRLPRLLLALVVGAALAFCGYLMQAMVNNGLADPYLLGTASGASLGAVIVFFGFVEISLGGFYMPPVFALAGAFVVTLVVVMLGYRKRQLIPAQLLLAGIAISALVTSIVGLLTFLSDSEGKLKSVIFWSMGSFERASWALLPYPAVALLLALLLFVYYQKQLNILLLGEERAQALGVRVANTRWVILGTVSVVTGFAVATSGPIGFVGLIIPHVTRGVMGTTGRSNLLFCAFVGGLFMLLCDLLSRLIYPPAGLPIGIITSFFGVPFFVYLLFRKNYNFKD